MKLPARVVWTAPGGFLEEEDDSGCRDTGLDVCLFCSSAEYCFCSNIFLYEMKMGALLFAAYLLGSCISGYAPTA